MSTPIAPPWHDATEGPELVSPSAVPERVSVVMPVYNAARFVGDAVESILCQTYPHFELIVVDDGSTDGTLDVVERYARRDDRIRVIACAANGGVSRATNAGIEAARGDWVAIMHADDLALPRRLEKQVRAAREHPEVVGWGAYAVHINADGEVLSLSATGSTSVEAFARDRADAVPTLIIHSSALLRKSAVLAAGGYDPSFKTCEDLDLFDRLAEHGPIVALPEPLVARRLHPETNTVRTFFTMLHLTRFVAARRRARQEGRPAPDLEAFARQCAAAPRWRRAASRLNDLCQYKYHEAAVRYGRRRYVSAALAFLVAAVLNPVYTFPRVWNQLFVFRMRSARPGVATPARAAAPSVVYGSRP